MGEVAQWVAYRVTPGAVLRAPLPSAPEVGQGWRGIDLRIALQLEQLEQLVADTAFKTDAAIGLHVEDSFAYGTAFGRTQEPLRFVLGVRSRKVPEAAADAMARCGISAPTASWRKGAARGLAAWSVHAPAHPAQAVLYKAMAPQETVGISVDVFLAALGLTIVEASAPDPLTLQTIARVQLAATSKPRRTRRWFRDR
ncbi:MAG: hypothetical protein ACM3OO_00430 [Planctomycetaceae bacterium]